MRGSPWSAEEMKSLGRRRPAEVQAVSQTGTTATPRLSACKSICQLERAGEEGRGRTVEGLSPGRTLKQLSDPALNVQGRWLLWRRTERRGGNVDRESGRVEKRGRQGRHDASNVREILGARRSMGCRGWGQDSSNGRIGTHWTAVTSLAVNRPGDFRPDWRGG